MREVIRLKIAVHILAASALLIAIVVPQLIAQSASRQQRHHRPSIKRSGTRAAAEKAPTATVPTLVLIEAGESTSDRVPRIHIGIGQYTALYTTSPIRQLVSTLIDAATITVKENRRTTEDNVAYLTAAHAGARGNCWIETGDGIVEVEILTTAGPAYTREVQIKTKGHRAEMQALKLRAQYAESESSRLTAELDNAKAAVQSALQNARDAKESGFSSGMIGGLLALERNLAGARLPKFSEIKSGALRVRQVGRPVRTPTGWLTLYRVENKSHTPVSLQVTADSGSVVMATPEAHVLARSTATLAMFISAPDRTRAPQLQFTSSEGPGLVAALIY